MTDPGALSDLVRAYAHARARWLEPTARAEAARHYDEQAHHMGLSLPPPDLDPVATTLWRDTERSLEAIRPVLGDVSDVDVALSAASAEERTLLAAYGEAHIALLAKLAGVGGRP